MSVACAEPLRLPLRRVIGEPATRSVTGHCARTSEQSRFPFSPWRQVFCLQESCMTFKGITVSVEAYEKLKALKGQGDSFSKVLLRELRSPGQSQQDDVAKALRTLQRASSKMLEETAEALRTAALNEGKTKKLKP